MVAFSRLAVLAGALALSSTLAPTGVHGLELQREIDDNPYRLRRLRNWHRNRADTCENELIVTKELLAKRDKRVADLKKERDAAIPTPPPKESTAAADHILWVAEKAKWAAEEKIRKAEQMERNAKLLLEEANRREENAKLREQHAEGIRQDAQAKQSAAEDALKQLQERYEHIRDMSEADFEEEKAMMEQEWVEEDRIRADAIAKAKAWQNMAEMAQPKEQKWAIEQWARETYWKAFTDIKIPSDDEDNTDWIRPVFGALLEPFKLDEALKSDEVYDEDVEKHVRALAMWMSETDEFLGKLNQKGRHDKVWEVMTDDFWLLYNHLQSLCIWALNSDGDFDLKAFNDAFSALREKLQKEERETRQWQEAAARAWQTSTFWGPTIGGMQHIPRPTAVH